LPKNRFCWALDDEEVEVLCMALEEFQAEHCNPARINIARGLLEELEDSYT
jgi:hypothetical protein